MSSKKRKAVNKARRGNDWSKTRASQSESDSGSVWDESESVGNSSRGSSVDESIASDKSSIGKRRWDNTGDDDDASIVRNPQKTTVWHAIYTPEMARLKALKQGLSNAQMTQLAKQVYHQIVNDQRQRLEEQVRKELELNESKMSEKQIQSEVEKRFKEWARRKADTYRVKQDELIQSGQIKLRTNTNRSRKKSGRHSSKKRASHRREPTTTAVQSSTKPEINESLVQAAAAAAQQAALITGGGGDRNDNHHHESESDARGFLLFVALNDQDEKNVELLLKRWRKKSPLQQQSLQDHADRIIEFYKKSQRSNR